MSVLRCAKHLSYYPLLLCMRIYNFNGNMRIVWKFRNIRQSCLPDTQ